MKKDIQRQIDICFDGWHHVPRPVRILLDHLEALGIIDLASRCLFRKSQNVPYDQIGSAAFEIDYTLTFTGADGSVTLGFAADTGMFIAFLAPHNKHPQSEMLDSLNVDDPADMAGLASAIQNTLQAKATRMENLGRKVLREVSEICGSGADFRDNKLYIIGDPYEDLDRLVAEVDPILGVMLLPSREPVENLTPQGVAQAIVARYQSINNKRHEIVTLAG
jgi:hypothetical protein